MSEIGLLLACICLQVELIQSCRVDWQEGSLQTDAETVCVLGLDPCLSVALILSTMHVLYLSLPGGSGYFLCPQMSDSFPLTSLNFLDETFCTSS